MPNLQLDHNLEAYQTDNNPNMIAIGLTGGGGVVAIIFKDSNKINSLNAIRPDRKELIEYIKENRKLIEDHFYFNEEYSDELGQEKFETCSHRSEDIVDSIVKTCCGTTMISGYLCTKRGFKQTLPSMCKACGDYLKKK